MQELRAWTELGVMQSVSVAKWFPCSILPSSLLQFLSTKALFSFSVSEIWYPNKEQALPWYLNLALIYPWWARGASVSLSLSQEGKQCLYFSLAEELQQSLNCHWHPGNPAGSGCLGNALNSCIPSCQGRVPFLQLFSSLWAVMVGTASSHLSPEALKLGSSGWKKKL